MNINLCRIGNISREDTPAFNSLSQQSTFFEAKTVKTIETTFYPPHYNNEIKVDTSDYSFTDAINYLFFEFDNKVYYYFIDAVEYLNENVVVLHITMDSVQTYMFDIEVNGILERLTLPRYVDGKINRNYIRENVSEGDFRLSLTKYLSGQAWDSNNTTAAENIYGWIVIKASSPLKKMDSLDTYGNNVPLRIVEPYHNEERRLFTGYYYYFIPVIDANSSDVHITGLNHADQEVTYSFKFSEYISYHGKKTQVVDIFFVPGQIFAKGYFTSIGHNNSNIALSESGEEIFVLDSEFGLTAKPDKYYTVRELVYTIEGISFESDSSVARWNPNVECCMLDENYIRISFGEQSGDSTYPLFQLTTTDITAHYWANILDGTRFYQLLGNTEYADVPDYSNNVPFGILPDPYRVCKSCATKLNYDLLTDPWIQWNDYNKSSIAMAFVGFAASAITKGLVAQNQTEYNLEDIQAIRNNPAARDNRFTTKAQMDRPFKTKFQRQLTGLERDNGRIRAQQYSSIAYSSGSLLSTATSYLNSWLAPDSPRQFGSINSDMLDNAVNQVVSIYKVNDYYNCAFYYHMNGYKVSIRASFNTLGYSGALSYYASREYFNVYKFSIVNVAMLDEGGTGDTATIEELKTRLINGIRFWNLNDTGIDTKCSIGYYGIANW